MQTSTSGGSRDTEEKEVTVIAYGRRLPAAGQHGHPGGPVRQRVTELLGPDGQPGQPASFRPAKTSSAQLVGSGYGVPAASR